MPWWAWMLIGAGTVTYLAVGVWWFFVLSSMGASYLRAIVSGLFWPVSLDELG